MQLSYPKSDDPGNCDSKGMPEARFALKNARFSGTGTNTDKYFPWHYILKFYIVRNRVADQYKFSGI